MVDRLRVVEAKKRLANQEDTLRVTDIGGQDHRKTIY